MEFPLVSIIVPTFNYGHFLKETINSVLNQTYKNIECIIVDDGSTDNTSFLVAEFSSNSLIKYFYKPNGGLSSARNYGIQHSTGSYLIFLDADDLLSPRKIELNISFLLQNTSVDIVYNNAYYFNDSQPDVYFNNIYLGQTKWMSNISGSGLKMIEQLVDANFLPINAVMISKASVNRIGNFKNSLKAVEDWDYWFRAALYGINFSFDLHPDAYALIRVHANSMSKSVLNQKRAEIKMRKRYAASITNYSSDFVIHKEYLMKVNWLKINFLEMRYFNIFKTVPEIFFYLIRSNKKLQVTTNICKALFKRLFKLI